MNVLPPSETGRPGRLQHVALLSSYALVAIVFTFPLIRHPLTSFAAGDDAFGFIWNSWWIHYAVTTLHVRPYITDFVFAPFTVDLRLHTFGLLYGLIAIPLMPMLGPVGVLNTQTLATVALNGYAMYRLISYITKSQAAGFVSGLLLSATVAINFHLTVGRASCAAVWPAIFAMLAFLSLVERPAARTCAWLVVAVVATMMADQQTTLFCAGWLTILLISLLISRPREVTNARFLVALAVAVALASVPAYLLYWRPFARASGYTVPGAVEAFRYSYPLRLLWSPSMIWRVYGVLMPIGLLAALGLNRRMPAVFPWLLGTMLFVVLSLGPVAAGTTVPLPFALVQALPGLAQFRTPYRFQIAAALVPASRSASTSRCITSASSAKAVDLTEERQGALQPSLVHHVFVDHYSTRRRGPGAGAAGLRPDRRRAAFRSRET